MLEYDIVAVGGGTGGLVTAAGAAYLGADAALVEKDALGGDCLWTGCVPSKALLASARVAHAMRHASRLGLRGASPRHAFGEVMDRMRRARERVAEHDDPERFREMGVDVHFGRARFVDPATLEVDGVGTIRSPRIVVATGAVPAVPPIPGLADAGYLTHESALESDVLPDEIVVLGAGPVGLEFAQVYARLGAAVTVVEIASEILPVEDPDVGATLRSVLEDEGIAFRTAWKAEAVDVVDGRKQVRGPEGAVLRCDEIFVATGRTPCTEGLEPERAGIETDGAALRVDGTLRTSASGVWAVGDVTGGLQFTHLADAMAKTALRNALFPFSTRVDYSAIPRVTYTDPEVARVGLGRNEAAARGGETHRYELHDLDRAIVDGRTEGFVEIAADRKGGILGATIVGAGAGDLLQPVVLAMEHDLTLADLSDTVHPYPTMVEGVKRAADAYQRSRLEGTGGRILRKVVSWLT